MTRNDRGIAAVRPPFRASDAERASIRALKNWLLAGPCESPIADHIVRLRIAAAIAEAAAARRPGERR